MSEAAPHDDVERLIEQEFGPVIGHFTVLHLPDGDAPEHVRTSWIGLRLPIRVIEATGPLEILDLVTGKVVINHDPIRVHGFDAKAALVAAENQDAIDYWDGNGGDKVPMEETFLVFGRGEGVYEPLEQD